jgi:threonine/homoserine/homoserine lactone efflux protein
MNSQALSAFALFAFVSSITPGPNNMMLLASGVNFGFKRTIPHMLGVAFGFGFMLCAVALGFHEVLVRLPAVFSVMKWTGIAYLLWLAWNLARDRAPIGAESANTQLKPMTFLNACAFQWINPKAWWMAVTASTTFLPSNQGATGQTNVSLVAVMVGLFVCVNLPSVSTWAWFGSHLRKWLSNPVNLARFNLFMALLLILSILPMIFDFI